MKRLVLTTGKWSAVLSIAYMKSRADHADYENTLLHISHICDQSYLDNFDRFLEQFHEFEAGYCVNYCVYKKSTPEHYMNGDLAEKKTDESRKLFRDILGDTEFDEIIVPHLFSNTSRLLLSMYPEATGYCIEEGLNSYFRHYNKRSLNNDEKYFVSRLCGYVSFNFLGLQPLFDYEAHGVPVIVPALKHLRETVEAVNINDSLIDTTVDGSRVLFIGQFARADMSTEELLNHYVFSISSLLYFGISVYFVKHPRDTGMLSHLLTEAFVGQKFHIVNAPDVPVERIASCYEWSAVFSYASTALVTIPAMYSVPAFTIDEFDPDRLVPGAGDFGNARNLCAAVIPTLRTLLTRLDANKGDVSQATKRVFASFTPKRDLLKKIYNHQTPPVSLDLEAAKKLPLLALQRRIKQRPYNSALRLAASLKEQKYGRSVKLAWYGVLLNLHRAAGYGILLKALIKPIWKLKPQKLQIPTTELEILRVAEKQPMSLEALYGYARFYEKKRELGKASRFWYTAVFTHFWNLRCYIQLIAWLYRKHVLELRTKRSGLLFEYLFDRSVRRVKRKARAIRANRRLEGKDIAALTYRPNRGATGGPGGVLALQKVIVGPYFRERLIDYLFRDKQVYPDWYADLASGASFALDVCATGRYGYYITHDLGCAYGLALAGRNYVLYWHFQGSFVMQNVNFGDRLHSSFIRKVKYIEAVAMRNAKCVVFPSDGARDMYFSDEYRSCEPGDVKVGDSVYNTILPGEASPDLGKKGMADFNGLTFTSVGTLTAAKGQDQVLDFFERMLPASDVAIRWVCIGNGVMKEELLDRAEKLQIAYSNFTFRYRQRVEHKEVMSILSDSDVYIMLHRISIFDFATLEAMKNSCAIVLSKVGGNVDFNKDGNIIFAEDVTFPDKHVFSAQNVARLKTLNTDVFNRYFSVQNFKEQNLALIGKMVAE